MRRKIIPAALTMLALGTSTLLGQTRDYRAERFVLDDNNGNTIVVQTPAGPITGGTLTIPDPGGSGQFLITNPSGGSQSVSGDILPGADDTYDLGSGASRWQDIFLSGNATVGGQVRYVETGGGTDYVGFQAPAAITANQIWTLPAADGTAGQALVTDGSGVLSWATAGGSVSTNTTLLGDGTGGNPLRINLGNGNTWTGLQTFANAFSIFQNARIAMTNNDNNARDIRWQEPSGTGSQYIGLRAPSVAQNSNYVFPTAIGTAGQVLTLGTVNGFGDSATLTWTTPGGGGTVTTNATLTGDGSGGSPLGINLSNGNTWTGLQTFANAFSIFQNARIAMTNNDNNARDIRWQEPSGTGSQYIGLRAPSVAQNSNYVFPTAIGTAGQVLTLGTVNGFGDSATLQWAAPPGGSPVFSRSDVTVTAGANNLLASSGATLIRITGFTGGAGAFTVSGISGGADGKMVVILNQTGQNMTVSFEDVGETAGNRILNTAGGTTNTIGSGNYIMVYDGGAARWEVVLFKN
ncbi:MAG: hypothetical protein H6616_16730 [Ignavibacteria bacterium]|nr:hypothetical protein [Ignavibacteria bacterium]